jgi:predicted HTH transcriptional regulator
MNTDGGTLIVGVIDDTKEVIGIANDLKMFKSGTVDEYERVFRQAIMDAIGVEFGPYVKLAFPMVDGVQVCRVDVAPAPTPVFLEVKGNQGKEFYIRSGNRSDPLDPAATHGYITMHWGG